MLTLNTFYAPGFTIFPCLFFLSASALAKIKNPAPNAIPAKKGNIESNGFSKVMFSIKINTVGKTIIKPESISVFVFVILLFV